MSAGFDLVMPTCVNIETLLDGGSTLGKVDVPIEPD